MTLVQRQQVLSAYRKLIQLCQLLTDTTSVKQADVYSQIRHGFKSSKNESDPKILEGLLQKATSSIGYLKMITPKFRGKRERQQGTIIIKE